jgi:hypothetical protein
LQKPTDDLTAHTHLIITRATIHRAIILWQKWYLSLSTALGANNLVHLAGLALTSHSANQPARLGTAGSAAIRATLWLVQETFLLIELLLTSGEHKVLAAYAAPEGFVFEVQLGTSP